MSQSIDHESVTRAMRPLDDVESTTQDLRDRLARARTNGATAEEDKLTAAEQRLRTRSFWMIVTGSTSAALTVGLAIVWHIAFRSNLPLEFILPAYALEFGALLFGCIEHISRTSRTFMQEILKRTDQIELGLQQLVDLLPTEMQQRWYDGYACGHQDARGQHTGTENVSRMVGMAEVLKLQRRNHN
jgi:hypothetical protein